MKNYKETIHNKYIKTSIKFLKCFYEHMISVSTETRVSLLKSDNHF